MRLPLPESMQEIKAVLSTKCRAPDGLGKDLYTRMFERFIEIEEEHRKSGYYGSTEWRAVCEKWKMCSCENQCDCYMR